MSNHELVDKIIYWICDEAKNKTQVINLIKAHSPSEITEETIYSLLQQAFDKLSQCYSEESDPVKVINQHIQWYEHIYAYFRRIKNASGANKAMQAKERLLNILKEGNKLTFKKSETIIHTTSGAIDYDASKLTPKEQNRLNELLQKAIIQ